MVKYADKDALHLPLFGAWRLAAGSAAIEFGALLNAPDKASASTAGGVELVFLEKRAPA